MSAFTCIDRKFNLENLEEDTHHAVQSVLARDMPKLLYCNPIVTVYTNEPTARFFHRVRLKQSQWCKQARPIFGRSTTRRVGDWFMGEAPDKSRQWLARSLHFVGIYLIEGCLVPNHEWRKWEQAVGTSVQQDRLAVSQPGSVSEASDERDSNG